MNYSEGQIYGFFSHLASLGDQNAILNALANPDETINQIAYYAPMPDRLREFSEQAIRLALDELRGYAPIFVSALLQDVDSIIDTIEIHAQNEKKIVCDPRTNCRACLHGHIVAPTGRRPSKDDDN
ncbi:MAG: hypothetical protein V1738_02805 [Patescibacteria group bacterium]